MNHSVRKAATTMLLMRKLLNGIFAAAEFGGRPARMVLVIWRVFSRTVGPDGTAVQVMLNAPLESFIH